ncbi:MAG: bifunctional diaminohydroxyphosphoribosylaminopyrimidine deaminase/5-amino-6-(5-phosphoribosylamino)uracil reductase RibD [Candidatus Delongbacteria bacterium]
MLYLAFLNVCKARTSSTDEKEKYMGLALREALKGAGTASPNPIVGAIIVKNGKIIGKGCHKKFGGPHAEVNAISSCVEDPCGSDMYVTLEPCSHFGKTPPCTDLIIKEKIRRVYIGTTDPSPHSNGRGTEVLRRAGVEVECGVLEKECIGINEPFFHSLRTGMPLIILKAASSLDGSLATDNGDSKWISSEKSRKMVHRLRNFYDAVLVGRNTVEKDDPLLTVRHCRGRNPVRIVTDEHLSLSPDKKIFGNDSGTIIITSKTVTETSETKYKNKGISIIKVDENNGELDLEQAFRTLHSYGIRSILAEGGAAIFSYLINNRLADKIVLFLAPKLIGSSVKFFSGSGIELVSDSVSIEDVKYKRSGVDLLVEGNLRYSD